MQVKLWYSSKTVWFNVLTAIVTVATIFGYVPSQTVESAVSALVIALNPFVNLVLRYYTKQPIVLNTPSA